jgi:hypothetical protein
MHFLGDAHVYANHIEALQEHLLNATLDGPLLLQHCSMSLHLPLPSKLQWLSDTLGLLS